MASKIIPARRQIARTIGLGRPIVSILSSAIVASTFFFYVFNLGSYFKVPIYVIEGRLTNNIFFADTYLITRTLDHVIIASGTLLWLVLSSSGKTRLIVSAVYGSISIFAILVGADTLFDLIILISAPLIISLLVYNKISNKKILHTHTDLAVNYFAIICIALGIFSIILSSILIFSSQATELTLQNNAYILYLLASSFSTILMFLLIFCVPLKLLVKESEKIILKFKSDLVTIIPTNEYTVKIRTKIFYLSLVIILSVALATIPHQPHLNTDNHNVGADTPDYVTMLVGLKNSTSVGQFFHNAFTTNNQGDRPLSLIFLYALAKLSPGDFSHTVDYVPIVLGPLLVIIIYFLTRELTSNDITSILASFLTVVSFHTLIGIYAGFYANWFALIIGYLSFVFLFRYLKESGKINLILYGVLLVLVLFAHVYTWSILDLVIGIFVVAMLKTKHYTKRRLILVLLIALSSVAIDFARTSVIGTYSGIASDLKVADVYGVGFTQFVTRWDNLSDTVHSFFGGMFGNALLLILGLYWLLRSNFRQPFNIFLSIFLSIGIIPISFGDGVVQARVFYEIPFQIPAAIALTFIMARPNGIIICVPFFVWLIAVSIINVSNF